jgi:MoxR-like ATPase
MTGLAREVYQNPLVLDYIARIVDATRNATQVRLGVSVRGAMALAKASRTWALAHGRTYVTPDDVKMLAEPILAHRLILDPEAEFDGVTATAIIGQILLDTPPPSQKDLV